MAINAATSTTSSAQHLPQMRQQGQTQQSQVTKLTDEAAKPALASQQTNKPEQPKPVVNTQGQTTGRLVNITA